MQILDANDFNVRTAVYLLQRDTIEFEIIPVVHVGSETFYEEVKTELDKCDIILFEGVGLKALKPLRGAYRQFAKRLGLASQGDAIDLEKYKGKLIHADLDAKQSEIEWQKIPFFSRKLFEIALPLGLKFLSLWETRDSFAEAMKKNPDEIDDQLWFMDSGKTETVQKSICDKREQVILDLIDKQLIKLPEKPKRIGIIYGAAHMKKVIRYLLDKHQFKIREAWFLTVFWLTDSRFGYKREETQS